MPLAKNSHEGRADRLVVDAAETRRVLETLLGSSSSTAVCGTVYRARQRMKGCRCVFSGHR
jgi:hypothetical protein